MMRHRWMPVTMTTIEEVGACFLFFFSFLKVKDVEYGGFGSVSGKIETDIKINHEGEVNR
jgi:hypothetical protein